MSKWWKIVGIPIVVVLVVVNLILLVDFLDKKEAGAITDQVKWIFSIAYVVCMLFVYQVGSGFIINFYHNRLNELYPYVMEEPILLSLEEDRVNLDFNKLEKLGLQPQRYRSLRQKDLKALRKLVHENRMALYSGMKV